MRTTLNLDDRLMEEAAAYTGVKEKTALLHEGLRALTSPPPSGSAILSVALPGGIPGPGSGLNVDDSGAV